MKEKYGKEILGFNEILAEKVKLWESIIRDSNFSDGIKDKFLSVISKRFGKSIPTNESIDDWIYFSISQLLVVVDTVAREEGMARGDLMSLFENLRDDIWQFYKEINK